jgi:hypothetical protein
VDRAGPHLPQGLFDKTVRGFGWGASPPLASREFKRYFSWVERRVR